MDYCHLVTQKEIDLTARGLNDDNIEVLVQVVISSRVLEKLILAHNRLTLTDGNLTSALSLSRTIRHLDLSHNRIDDDGVEWVMSALKVNESVRVLHLDGNRIGDFGCIAIHSFLMTNQNLQTLSLRNNQIEDKCGNLAAGLRSNKSLHELWLGGNNIGDLGALHLLTIGLQNNDTIQKIDLSYTEISDEILDRIETNLCRNQLLITEPPTTCVSPLVGVLGVLAVAVVLRGILGCEMCQVIERGKILVYTKYYDYLRNHKGTMLCEC